mmetsp:Transcript_50362/g.144074  ORF Transcript_50362/g.144074 Transcript_50362/m.144074 type:complete len:262 (-) Transcript_50362:3-788(-)
MSLLSSRVSETCSGIVTNACRVSPSMLSASPPLFSFSLAGRLRCMFACARCSTASFVPSLSATSKCITNHAARALIFNPLILGTFSIKFSNVALDVHGRPIGACCTSSRTNLSRRLLYEAFGIRSSILLPTIPVSLSFAEQATTSKSSEPGSNTMLRTPPSFEPLLWHAPLRSLIICFGMPMKAVERDFWQLTPDRTPAPTMIRSTWVSMKFGNRHEVAPLGMSEPPKDERGAEYCTRTDVTALACSLSRTDASKASATRF